MSWSEIVAGIEALEPARLDAALVARTESVGATDRAISFYTPTFKTYASSELSSCGKNAWPAVSITGGNCKLQCDHCKAKVLEPMIPATTPESLWRVMNEQIERGARGMLLTGGSNHRDEVEYGPFLPVVRRLKHRVPSFRIALHTALVDRDMACAMAEAGVDVAMLDIIGAQDTVSQVYHLRRPVADFERSLEHLVATSMKVVPHIVIGLHYGRMLGEWQALEMIARHRPDALVLVVAMPFYAPANRPFATPLSREVGSFFLDARAALPETPVLLGCARPPGRARIEIDVYAALAGLAGIAHPADGVVELALKLGRDVNVIPACCSIAVGEQVLGFQDPDAPRIDPWLVAQAGKRAPSRIARIPVVASCGAATSS
ncbi:MAG: radical SAM protein [Betaproteobacteria bacterium]|nr:radical SAM protein [Betaproteobacteria bacterium]